ncbi:MAG: tetratricopeptide repeat protein, partial [Planctomycetota bacterium]
AAGGVVSRRKRARKRKAAAELESAPAPPGRGERIAGRLAERMGSLARTRWFFPVALVVLTVAVYARSVPLPLHYWDDTQYLFEDPRIDRLSLGGSWRILAEPFHANYHPLTTFTYAFDRAVWDVWLPGHHLTQIAFYAAGIVVLYFLFRALFSSGWAAFAAAAIYATHAIHVESVAWLASRKDVVCLVFYAASLLYYVRYAREGENSPKLYAAFTAFAVAAMFSKGYAAVLPAVFLAYDFCNARKLRLRHFVEKIPLFIVGAALTVAMILAQEKDATPVPVTLTLGYRLGSLGKVFALYVARTVLPVRLSAMYVIGSGSPGAHVAVAGAILLAGTVAGFFALRRRAPLAAFGIAVFLIQLSTVMSTFFTLRTWMADRYLLFPTIGSTLALVAGARWFVQSSSVPIPARVRRPAAALAAACAVAVYSALSVARIGAWTNEITLWSDCLRKQNGLAGSGPVTVRELRTKGLRAIVDARPLIRLARAYERAGDRAESSAIMAAAGSFPRTAEMAGETEALARGDIAAGRYDEAIAKLRPVAEGRAWRAPRAWTWIGVAHEKKGEPGKARAAHEKALGLYRESGRSGADALLALGRVAYQADDFEGAAERYRQARSEAPRGDPRPAFFLGRSLEESGRVKEAYRLYEEAAASEGRVPPNVVFGFADVYMQMGVAAEKLGRAGEAIRHLEKALELAPRHRQAVDMHLKIGLLAEKTGDYEEAARRFEDVLRRAPGDPRRDAIRARLDVMRRKAAAGRK